MTPTRFRVAVAIVLMVALVLRIAWPLADPESRLSWSTGIYTDPPTMVHAARSAVLFRDWTPEPSRDLWVYPLMNAITWVAFVIFGPGRLATILLSILFGTTLVGAIAWGVNRSSGALAATIAAGLAAVCSWLVFYARIPVAENLVAMMCAFACVAVLGRSARSQALAGALGVAATLFGKYHAIGFLPALPLTIWLRERRFRALLPLLAGGTAVFAIWVAIILVPHADEIIGHVKLQSTGAHGPFPFLHSLREGFNEIYNTARRSWMFYRVPVIGSLGVLFAIWSIGNGDARRRRIADGSIVWALWFLGMWFYLALLPYKAPRYYVLVIPPLVAGSAILLSDLLTSGDRALRSPSRWDEHVPLMVWLYSFAFGALLAMKHYASMIVEYLILPPSRISDEAFDAITRFFDHVDTFDQNLAWAAVVAIVLYLALLWHPEVVSRIRRREGGLTLSAGGARWLAVAMLAVSVGWSAWQYGWWAVHRTTFLEEVKSTLPKLVGDGAVLLGPMAPVLAEDTKFRVLPYFGPDDVDDPIAEYGVTHFVVTGKGVANQLEDRFPGVLDQTVLVQSWPVRTLFASTLEVRRLPPVLDGVRIHEYEPTLYERGAEAANADLWEEALDWFERYREAGGEDTPELHSLESVCWFRLGDYVRARALLEDTIRRRPHDSLNYQNLGVLALREGDRREALDLLMKANRLDPTNRELQSLVRELTR